MTLADAPLAAFDLETSGVDVRRDRIVTASVVVIGPDGPHPEEWLLDPGIDIPDEAARVHGVTTDKARADGQDYADGYRQIRDRLETLWAHGKVVAIMNAAFDLSLLHWEGLRLGYPDLVPGPVIDPYVIDKQLDRFRKGKRTLTALCAHYGLRQDDAHQATGDALAAARLAWRMARLPDLAEYDTTTLMAVQAQWRADQQQSLHEYFLRQGNHDAAASVSGEWPVQRSA